MGGAPGAPTASNDTSAVHAISPSSPPSPLSYSAAVVEVPADDEREELRVPLGRAQRTVSEKEEADERLGHGVVVGAAREGAHGEEAVREGVLVAEGRELVELRERARR